MNILIVGDTVARPGRRAVQQLYPKLKKEFNLDFAIVNGENIAGGSGLTVKTLNELLASGIDVVTSGDHMWRKREILNVIDDYKELVRPANYPIDAPGQGSVVLQSKKGEYNVGVINILGRVFMQPIDCPFLAVMREIDRLKPYTNCIIVDFHAEATAEKVAMGWYLNGLVSAVVGTHTHVQTADETILDKGTAYITDLGMTGPMDSVIGRKKEQVIEKFVTQINVRFDVASDHPMLHGVVVSVDPNTGKATHIQRVARRCEDD